MAAARNQVKHTWPAIAGYTIGCGLGAGTDHVFRLWALGLPTALALLACLMGLQPAKAG
jgi:hypothetical protein